MADQAPKLHKIRSWSPDIRRDQEWQKMKQIHQQRRHHLRRHSMPNSLSLTDYDLKELRACFELGFGFNFDSSSDIDPRLSQVFPALDLYGAVSQHRYYKGSSLCRSSSSSSASDFSFDLREDSEVVKRRLKHWAQAVACSIMQVSNTNGVMTKLKEKI